MLRLEFMADAIPWYRANADRGMADEKCLVSVDIREEADDRMPTVERPKAWYESSWSKY